MSAGPEHSWPVRVYYDDTDAGGVVYHARYLAFAERARTEYLRACGIDHSGLRDQDGGVFVVRRATLDFKRPARLDDHLMVHTRAEIDTGVRMSMHQEIKKGDQPIVIVDVELAFISLDMRPMRLPPRLSRAFRAALGETAGDA